MIIKILTAFAAIGITATGCIWAIKALLYSDYSLSPNTLTIVAGLCMVTAANSMLGEKQ